MVVCPHERRHRGQRSGGASANSRAARIGGRWRHVLHSSVCAGYRFTRGWRTSNIGVRSKPVGRGLRLEEACRVHTDHCSRADGHQAVGPHRSRYSGRTTSRRLPGGGRRRGLRFGVQLVSHRAKLRGIQDLAQPIHDPVQKIYIRLTFARRYGNRALRWLTCHNRQLRFTGTPAIVRP